MDLLGQVHEALLTAAVEDETLIADTAFVAKLDTLAEAISTVRVEGDVEVSVEGEQKGSEKTGARLGVTIAPRPGVEARLTAESALETRELLRETGGGSERIGLNFSVVGRALRELARTLSTKRIWLLLDEWSSVPSEVQPYLGEFLVRCVLPLQKLTVKIAAIEQQTNFQVALNDGTSLGIELGADVAANIDLDEFMVFEQHEERARAFFRGLLFKHLTSGVD